MQIYLYYFFAALLLFAALLVISVRNPVHAALSLVLAFFSAAAIWLLLAAEFLAILLVLIYVGAVMVLFLFVVMMLDINLVSLREGFVRYLALGVGAALLMMLAMWGLLQSGVLPVPETPPPAPEDNTRQLGILLFERYYYAFQLAGAVLLVAGVAAISLTLRSRRATRTPVPARQVQVRRADRVRLVRMESEGGTEGGDDA